MKNHQGRYCPVALALMATLWPQAGWSESYFNPAFLSDDTASVADLSRFEQGHQQAPGVYRVDIWRNDEFIGTQDVRFEQAENTPPGGGRSDPVHYARDARSLWRQRCGVSRTG